MVMAGSPFRMRHFHDLVILSTAAMEKSP